MFDDFLLRIQELQIHHFLIVCDGIIGCGKTTFLDELSRSMPLGLPEVQIFREPVAEDAENTWWPLLADFYTALDTASKGSSSDAVAAVVKLEKTIWEHHERITTKRSAHAITERCCWSAVRVFCTALHEQGYLPDSQFKEFEEKLAAIDADPRYAPTLILHFKITVEAAMTRIQNRAKAEGRWFEQRITEEYLRKLLAKYESLYEGREDVIVIDSNMPTDEIKREVADKLENNEEKYCKVLKAKGFPEAQARRLLALMISCFKNSPQ